MTSGEARAAITLSDLDRLVSAACGRAGVAIASRWLLRHFANAVYLVEDDAGGLLTVRVAYDADAITRSKRGLSIAQWLAAQRFPVTEPVAVPSGRDQPIVVVAADAKAAVTFWRYYPQPASAEPPGPEELAPVARALHRIDAAPPVSLPSYEPLTTVSSAVRDPAAARVLGARSQAWLERRIDELRDEYRELRFPLGVGLIHGDMYAGNLLWSDAERRVVLGDWDTVCVGPRELDLAPTFTAVRFGLDQARVDRFATVYGYDLREWSGFPVLRAIRELSTLTALLRLAPADSAAARELVHRVDTLRRGDTTSLWIRQ